ncbi:DUF6232 family protein [Streptomyces sp. NPDC090025]|uniref:DUF6232 family protein n=1 Tax=Streptomyces sp. NPDC090025 TaxID=3365922 RepID=UPI003833D3AD
MSQLGAPPPEPSPEPSAVPVPAVPMPDLPTGPPAEPAARARAGGPPAGSPAVPPPGPPAPRPPGGPPPAPEPAPPVAPLPKKSRTRVLRVDRRILWVGTAAIPLHNITAVETFRAKPDRGSALLRFLKWLLVIAVLLVVLDRAAYDGDLWSDLDDSPVLFIPLIALAVFLLKELFEPARPVLSVQMASGATVLTTLPNMEQLREIAGRIVYAIDHPETEFTALVQVVSNTHNSSTNVQGPVVNMNGGQGNTGIKL